MHSRISGGKVAIYARFSSEQQREASIADQVRRCREYIAQAGGDPGQALIFEDRAISGSSLERPGFEAMMRAVDNGATDVVITEDLSRISRDFADAAVLFRKLRFVNVPLIGVADGINTDAKDAKLSFTLKSLIVDLYLDDLRDKTKRGLVGRAMAGFSTGSRPYGYGSEPAYDKRGRTIGYTLVIDQDQAKIVRRIFQEYAKGRSRPQIVRMLNAERIPWPTAHQRTKHGGWTPPTVRRILANQRYAGIWKYRETENIKKPGTNRVIRRKQDKSLVLCSERPELRIIEPKLWQVVQERLASVHRKYTRNRKPKDPDVIAGNKSNYLLTGLLTCGVCGGPMQIRAGLELRYYRCAVNCKKGLCRNKRTIREDKLRPAILEAIRERLMGDNAIAYVRERVASELREVPRKLERELAEHKARLARTEQRIQGLIEFIAKGDHSEYITNQLRELESSARADKDAIEQLSATRNAPLRLPSIEDVTEMVLDLDARLTEDPDTGRQVLRQWLDGKTITMTPRKDGRYTIKGGILPMMVLSTATKPTSQPAKPASQITQKAPMVTRGRPNVVQRAVCQRRRHVAPFRSAAVPKNCLISNSYAPIPGRAGLPLWAC